MTLEGIPQGYYVFETDRNGRIIKSTFRFYHEDVEDHLAPSKGVIKSDKQPAPPEAPPSSSPQKRFSR